MKADFDTKIKIMQNKFNWINLEEIKIDALIFMYIIDKDLAPKYCKDTPKVQEVHDQNTRTRSNFGFFSTHRKLIYLET